METGKVWAYVAHKDGHWAGVSAPDLKGIGKWIAGWIKDGFTVISIKDRDEWDAILKEMPPWSEHPDYKAKHPRRRALALHTKAAE